MRGPGFSSVWLLALVNAIALSVFPMMVLIGSLIGVELAGSERWATLPIALVVIGTATGVVPASRAMARWGRRKTFIGFSLIGATACLLAADALVDGRFSEFCLGAVLLGVANAALQQVRFAAMECVDLDRGPAAASVIMCAGIVAAVLGPELALLGRHLAAVEYRGSFWLGAGCFLLAAALFGFYTPAPPRTTSGVGARRSLAEILANPLLIVAVASGAVAFMVMSFVMTATPISMHLHHGHNLQDTKWVIQSHIAAMYLPSLVTAWLFAAIGIRGMMIAGLGCYALTITIGLYDVSVLGFWGQLVMLGIGWNFLFVSGTALLPTTYREGEQYRAQAVNDTVVFSTQAMAALTAGWAISAMNWQSLLLGCLLPVALMAGALTWQRQRF